MYAPTRRELVTLAARTRTPLLIDETMVETGLAATAPAPVAVHEPDGHMIISLGSASKRYWGGQQRGWIFVRDDKPFAVRVDGDLACNDGELLYGWVRQSLGVGWRSSWEIQAELKRRELVTVLDEFALPRYDLKAVYPQQMSLPA